MAIPKPEPQAPEGKDLGLPPALVNQEPERPTWYGASCPGASGPQRDLRLWVPEKKFQERI